MLLRHLHGRVLHLSIRALSGCALGLLLATVAPACKKKVADASGQLARGSAGLGEACVALADCSFGLDCLNLRCVFPGPCSAHLVTASGGVTWADRIRYRYDDQLRPVLEERVSFEHGAERRAELQTIEWSGAADGKHRTEYGDGKGYTVRFEADARGRVTRRITDFDGGPFGLMSVYEWPEGTTCELPPKIENRDETTNELRGWVEVECDEHGHAVAFTQYEPTDVGKQIVGRTKQEELDDGRRLVVLAADGDVTPTRATGPVVETRLDAHGNPIEEIRTRSGPEGFTETKTMDYSCWSYADGKVSGGPADEWTSLEPGPFVSSLAGRWCEADTGDELVFYDDGRIAAPDHRRQGRKVLSQTTDRAMLELADGHYVEVSQLDGGKLSVTIVQPGSSMGRAMHVTRAGAG